MAQHKKSLTLGIVTLIAFFIVLIIMFFPIFSGKNAFQAADDFFNSIAKGSSNYFDTVRATIETEKGNKIKIEVSTKVEQGKNFAIALKKAGAEVIEKGEKIEISCDYGRLLAEITLDSEAGYFEKGEELKGKYNMEPRVLLYTWWNLLKEMEKEFKFKKMFKEAKVANEVIGKAVEVAYNFYGIKAEKASSKFGLLTFVLTFYVLYTLWYGYGILWLFNGLGLEMKAGKKKEV